MTNLIFYKPCIASAMQSHICCCIPCLSSRMSKCTHVCISVRSYYLNPPTIQLVFIIKHSKNCKTLPREHFIGCQGVKMFLLKDPFKVFSSHKLRFVIIQVLSRFEFLRFDNLSFWLFSKFEVLSYSQFEFCHILSYWFLPQFEFCHNLNCWVLSQFELLSFVTIWFL